MFNGNHQIRTSWQIMMASVYTLTIRNLELRFIMKGSNKRLIDLLIIFFEPVGHVLLWSAIKLFKYPHIEGELSLPFFILLGVIPWLFTYNTINDCLSIFVQNKGLLFFKQIKPLDPVIALVFSEFMMLVLVFVSGLIVLSIFDYWHIQNPLRWFIAIFLYLIFVAGLAFIISCIGFFSKPIARLLRILLRFLYLFSGIFFSAQMVSPQMRTYFIINPLFQFIEISRGCFSSASTYDMYGDLYYLFESAIVSIFIGLGSYSMLKNKIMIEIMEH